MQLLLEESQKAILSSGDKTLDNLLDDSESACQDSNPDKYYGNINLCIAKRTGLVDGSSRLNRQRLERLVGSSSYSRANGSAIITWRKRKHAMKCGIRASSIIAMKRKLKAIGSAF